MRCGGPLLECGRSRFEALQNTISSTNTAIGYAALRNKTVGNNNIH
jgi:hypothetical protein